MFEHLLHTNIRYFLSILMLHTKMQYGQTCVTHKNMISKCACILFLHIKVCNVLFSFTFFRIWTDAYKNVPKAGTVRLTCFLSFGPRHSLC